MKNEVIICKSCGKSNKETLFEQGRNVCVDCRNLKRNIRYQEKKQEREVTKSRERKKTNRELLDEAAAEANRRGISYGKLQAEEFMKREREQKEREKRLLHRCNR